MNPISFYLGLKIERNCKQKTIKLSQPAYINKIIQKFYLNQANLINIYMNKRNTLLPNATAQVLASN